MFAYLTLRSRLAPLYSSGLDNHKKTKNGIHWVHNNVQGLKECLKGSEIQGRFKILHYKIIGCTEQFKRLDWRSRLQEKCLPNWKQLNI